MEKEIPPFLFWINHKSRIVFFSPQSGFDVISLSTKAEMQQTLYSYVESGYKVG